MDESLDNLHIFKGLNVPKAEYGQSMSHLQFEVCMNNSIVFEVNFSKKIAQTGSKRGLFFSFILSHFTAKLLRLPLFVNLTLKLAQLLGISSF